MGDRKLRAGRPGGPGRSGRYGRAAVLLVLMSSSMLAQGRQQLFRERSVVKIERGDWDGPRLSDGQPDVSGHWSNTIGNHNNLTDPQGGGADDERPRPLGARGD